MSNRFINIIIGWMASFCTVATVALIIDMNSAYAFGGRDAAVIAAGTLTGILIGQLFE